MSKRLSETKRTSYDLKLWSDVERIIELNNIRPSTVSSFHSFTKIRSRINRITNLSEEGPSTSGDKAETIIHIEPEHELWAHVKNLLDTDMPETVEDNSRESLENVKNWINELNPDFLDSLRSKIEERGL